MPPQPGYFPLTEDPYSLDNLPPPNPGPAPRRGKGRQSHAQQHLQHPQQQQQYIMPGPQPQRGGVIPQHYQHGPPPPGMGGPGPMMMDGGPMDHHPHGLPHPHPTNAKIIRGGPTPQAGLPSGSGPRGSHGGSEPRNISHRDAPSAGGAGPSSSAASGARTSARQAQLQQQQQLHAERERERERERELREREREMSPDGGVNATNLKRKREVQDRLVKYARDRYQRRDEITAEAISALNGIVQQLQHNPSENSAFVARFYPTTIERGAILNAIEHSEQHASLTIEMLFNHEMKQIEDDFEKSRARLKERVMEGLEERRRRAREEKEGEGVVPVESALEATTSALLRTTTSSANPSNSNTSINGPTPAPFLLAPSIPFGLSPDDLTSPFPLSLTSIAPPTHHSGPGRKPRAGGGAGGWGRGGGREAMLMGGASALALGKAIGQLGGSREGEVDSDLGEIRRAVKRRRAAVRNAGAL
ncbi:hypothetical protein DL93DRAFT_2077738 [Clavulina sp. PMI_390]|nr:hypothetical protein DL93DRAFT_2077738 [Clavulina sp. PMI_390]